MDKKTLATEEQLTYAKILDAGMKLGMIMLIISFFIYVGGILKPHIAVQDVSKYWGLKVSDYLYVVSQADTGKTDEALKLIKECKAAKPENRPAECKEISEKGHVYTGWHWLGMLGKGDFLNFVGVAFLAAITVFCYLAIIPIFFRKQDTIYGILAIIEVLVLTLAASGILKGGGH